MVTDGALSTPGRLLVASFLLSETVSFQVPARDKDGRFRPNKCSPPSSRVGLINPASSALSSSTLASRPAASIHPLAAVDTSNGAMSDQTQRSILPRGSAPGEMELPPVPSSPRFFKSSSSSSPSSGEAVTTVPKPISNKVDRTKDQGRPSLTQRASYHGYLGIPPPSILAPPSEIRETRPRVFPEAAPRPTLNQPRSRTGDHPSIHIVHKSQPERRSSIDSAQVFAEAAWTVEKAISGNIGLHNAVNSIQGQLSKIIWVGTLGMATDTLPERTRGDIKAELALNHSSIPVFVSDLDYEGHYHQFCKQVRYAPPPPPPHIPMDVFVIPTRLPRAYDDSEVSPLSLFIGLDPLAYLPLCPAGQLEE